jgi:RNA polymerase sigma-70 factor (ECF subfamily)
MEASRGAHVTVAGRAFNRAAFVASVLEKDPEATRALVAQIREDAARGGEHAPGLVLFSEAFRGRILGWLKHGRFPADPGAAEEVWNETLLRVWRKAGAYEESRSAFLTWAMNQARWAASDYRRHLPKVQEVTLSPGDDVSAAESEPEPLTKPEREALLRAFAHLTETQQLLVRWRFIAELPHGAIARDVLGGKQSEDNVRVYVNRAMAALRRYYDEELRNRPRKEGPKDG